ncbi:MAG: hypothetical protein M5U25_07265 [Planctomycetota bacterium]|nr:hypothetical protein [Planctomycetota bacterium]
MRQATVALLIFALLAGACSNATNQVGNAAPPAPTLRESWAAFAAGDDASALAGFNASAESGNRSGNYWRGLCLLWGWGTAEDLHGARAALAQAADAGHGDARDLLDGIERLLLGNPRGKSYAGMLAREALEQGMPGTLAGLETMWRTEARELYEGKARELSR